jgi:hypothetical protein
VTVSVRLHRSTMRGACERRRSTRANVPWSTTSPERSPHSIRVPPGEKGGVLSPTRRGRVNVAASYVGHGRLFPEEACPCCSRHDAGARLGRDRQHAPAGPRFRPGRPQCAPAKDAKAPARGRSELRRQHLRGRHSCQAHLVFGRRRGGGASTPHRSPSRPSAGAWRRRVGSSPNTPSSRWIDC